LLEREGPVDVGGVPMPLLLEGDDLPFLGQERQELAERGFDGRAAPVEQHEGHCSALG
jgi:hypothetical protein